MSGYVPSSGNNNGNMNGYATMIGNPRPRMGAAPGNPACTTSDLPATARVLAKAPGLSFT